MCEIKLATDEILEAIAQTHLKLLNSFEHQNQLSYSFDFFRFISALAFNVKQFCCSCIIQLFEK